MQAVREEAYLAGKLRQSLRDRHGPSEPTAPAHHNVAPASLDTDVVACSSGSALLVGAWQRAS
jgi:hypothetical protein